MSNNEFNETYKKYIKIHDENEIKNPEDIFNIIKENNKNNQDLRENYVFRGLKQERYELLPACLRESDNHVDDFIEPSKLMYFNSEYDAKKDKAKLQLEKEKYILSKFFNLADKTGLKVPYNKIRKDIHGKLECNSFIESEYEDFNYLYDSDYFEVISLAQHHGLPTRALDWTYDYKVALYFAVCNTLNNKNESCILWAINYKVFEDYYTPIFKNSPSAITIAFAHAFEVASDIFDEISDSEDNFPPNLKYPSPKLYFYRPEYNKNSRLSTQKGLFTIWTDYQAEKSLDKLVTSELVSSNFKNSFINGSEFLENNDLSFKFETNEKLLHKFKISGKLKNEILKELYAEGYSEEYLFPDYSGVIDSIRNRVKLNNNIK